MNQNHFKSNDFPFRNFILLSILLCITLGSLMVSCKKNEKNIGGQAVVETGADKSPLTAESNDRPKSEFWVVVETEFQNEVDRKIKQGECSFPLGAPKKGAPVNCQISIPEGQLFYSKLYFTMGANANDTACQIFSFSPYFYRISTSATYVEDPSNSGQKTNCSGLETDDQGISKSIPIPAACYGGVAKHIVPGFPSYVGRYFTRDTQDAGKFEVPSASTQNHKTNRWSANYFPHIDSFLNKSVYFSYVGDGFAGNKALSFRDYSFHCTDNYYETLYQINLVIRAVPIESDDETHKDFGTWLNATP